MVEHGLWHLHRPRAWENHGETHGGTHGESLVNGHSNPKSRYQSQFLGLSLRHLLGGNLLNCYGPKCGTNVPPFSDPGICVDVIRTCHMEDFKDQY